MLKLMRKWGEAIMIDDNRITVVPSKPSEKKNVKLTISFNDGSEGQKWNLPKGTDCEIEEGVTIEILQVTGTTVRLGVDAPKDMSINREEVWQKILAKRGRANNPTIATALKNEPWG